MSVGAFYLVVYTLLVVEKSNRAARQQEHTLGEILTEDQLLQLEDLVKRDQITVGWLQDVFVPRLDEELDHLDWLERKTLAVDLDDPKYGGRYDDPKQRAMYERARKDALDRVAERRANAFERALHPNVFQRAGTELQKVYRALLTGEIANRWKRYLKEEGAIGVAQDVGKNIVTFIPRGIATTARTFSEGGFGEHPIKRLAEISVAIPSIIALVRLILRILKQVVLPFILSMPKVLWNFILDRVRELGKAVRGEE